MDPNLEAVSKITVPHVLDRKLRGEKITCLTAYDYPTARLVDEAGTDVILVGDSLAQVVLGYDSTLPVTVDEMLHHLRAARRAVRRALLVADLPYGSYHLGDDHALHASVRYLKEGGAEAVKLEGGRKRAEMIRRLVDAEIPVMGHIGLTPQSVHAIGGYRVQGKTLESAGDLVADAAAVEDAGAFAVVLEGIPRELGAVITRGLRIPTIGIGAGPDCDGQVLVLHDLIGLNFGAPAKFVRPYAHLASTLRDALARFHDDVVQGRYPDDRESYHWSFGVREQFEKRVKAQSRWGKTAAGSEIADFRLPVDPAGREDEG
jgi:3-methyl-2-oxobutanoate hydroxymethyltransferase